MHYLLNSRVLKNKVSLMTLAPSCICITRATTPPSLQSARMLPINRQDSKCPCSYSKPADCYTNSYTINSPSFINHS